MVEYEIITTICNGAGEDSVFYNKVHAAITVAMAIKTSRIHEKMVIVLTPVST